MGKLIVRMRHKSMFHSVLLLAETDKMPYSHTTSRARSSGLQ